MSATAPSLFRDPIGYLGERLRVSRGFDRPVNTVQLGYRRIYILPTRAGIGFAMILIAMLLGSMNYSLSLGYVLTFLLAGLGLASMLHTFQNLNRLAIEVGRVDPVFQGETAVFHLIAHGGKQGHRSVWLRPGTEQQEFDPLELDLEPAASSAIRLRLDTKQRGYLDLERLAVTTEYPVGLFHSWSWLNLKMRCVVYPRPYPRALPLPPARGRSGAQTGSVSGRGTDDFQGLRDYVPGDSLRHIHWKALARGQGMMTKEFAGLADSALWLRLEDAPVPDLEGQLSVLTRWVVDAHSADQVYGLDLGAAGKVEPATGELHMHTCLTKLATYGRSR